MNAEKESNPKKAAQRRKQADSVPLALHETEKSYASRQDKAVQTAKSSNESSSALSGNIGAPAVHGPNTAYSDGSEQMHKQFKQSLDVTGDPSHPDTQQKEKEYKSTLSINELRDYHDIKSGNAVESATTEKMVVVPDAKPIADSASPKAVTDTQEKPIANAAQKDEAADKAEKEIEAKTPSAADNPGFVALQGQIDTTAKAQQKHEPAGKASKDAQAAAPSPANERESMAQASKVNNMSQKEPGLFSASAFKAELKKKIAGMKLPKNEEQADDFENNNNIKEVNQKAMGDVTQEKNVASGGIAAATAAKPNTAAQPVRNVAKMPVPNHGKAPAVANAAKAMPGKRDAASVEGPIKAETASIDEQMSANGVTDTMLANSNEPTFKAALGEKNKAKEQSEASTTQFRADENKQLGKTQNEAQTQAVKQIAGMHGARKTGLDKVHGNQNQTASKDTEKRKEIATKINGIYNNAKSDVDKILSSLDSTVAYKFSVGSKAAKAAFEKHIDDKMAAYKRKRYGDANKSYGALAAAGLWLWDKVAGLPEEVNKFFVSGKDEYVRVMDIYITDIANHVAGQLNAAKRRIATGKKDVQTYVDSLSPSLKKLGAAAINEIQGKFSALEKDVDSKKDALIDALAKKYAENMESIDTRIKELKEQNKGLVGKVMNAMTGIFAFIIEVKNTLMNLLAKVAEVIGAIIMDPIGFFSNMIAGVGQGFSNFTANIWTHLKTGFFTWLTGATKGVSITMPEDIFSLKGIFSITMQVLGLGWDGIRAIGVNVVGEPLMKALEGGVEIVQVIRKDGIAGLWEYLKDQFQDLKETIMDAIMDIIQNQVIQAGVKWILGLLSPVGAFVKAIMAIIDVVKFFIQRAAQIAELISAFMDSVAAIASGKVGAVAKAIENALAKAIPVLIGLLAAILGISGLADKVLAVIRKIRQRITNGITKFWNFVKAKGKGLLNKVSDAVGKKDNKTKDERKKEGKSKEEKKKEQGKPNSENIESWDDVVTFKNVENVEHTLYFKGEGDDAKLYMQSKNDHVLKHLSNAEKVAQTPAEKKAVSDGVAYYNSNVLSSNNTLWKLEKEHRKLVDNNKDGKNDSKIKANEDAIKKQNGVQDNVLDHLAVLFKAIRFDDGVLPTNIKTNVTSKQDEFGRAKEVEAKPLTWIAGNTKGSSPYQDPKGWEYATEDIRNSIYIRGHMLNDNIHGPGAAWNLVPITRVMNSNMEVKAESVGKQVLAEKNRHMIMGYKTTVEKYHPSADNENDKYFPKEIKIEWGEYKNNDGQYDVNAGYVKTGEEIFTQGKPAMPYNINDLGETLLIDKLKLNANFAKAVNEERKKNGAFTDMRTFEIRLNNYYINRKDVGIFNLGMDEIYNLKESNKITF